MALLSFVIVGAHQAFAQDLPSPGSTSGQDTNPAPPKDAARSSEVPGQYIILGTDRQVALNPLLKYQLIYGMDITEGYDDGVVLFPSKTGVYYTLWTPRLGII
jgi:hypothetical protein